MKKFTALVLCLAIFASLIPSTVFAASGTLVFEEGLAEDLKALGLFKGVSETDFALGRAPTRVEALVMLIRVLGKESDALSKGGRHPFLDVPDWAKNYVGYAYENNLTNGISATKFGSTSEASASMYLTFVLRALGYSDKNGDFTWDNPFALARQTGIMKGNPNVTKFLRGDVVLVSYAALEAEVKGTGKTLADKLIASGALSAAKFDSVYKVAAFETANENVTFTSEEIYKKCSPAVFYIELYDAKGDYAGSGSGFFIDSDGTAVTNYHVIDDITSAKIRTTDGRIYKVAGVYDYGRSDDWAVIRIDGNNFPYLEIDKSEVVGGQVVYAIGSPKGLENTISEGLISNANRIIDGVRHIQISVPISPGSSGGALLNKQGKVIGITSGGFNAGQNLNLAMPISVIDGFNKDKLTLFSNKSNPFILGNVDVSGLSKEGAALELLRCWIANYGNEQIDGSPVYYESVDYDDGNSETFILTYNDEYDFVTVHSFYYLARSGLIQTRLTFTADSPAVIAEYFYYNNHNDRNPSVTGTSNILKSKFYNGMSVSFDETNAYYMRESHETNAVINWFESLTILDAIIRDELMVYGVYGLSSLGFDNIDE